jgi:hypothetical protein
MSYSRVSVAATCLLLTCVSSSFAQEPPQRDITNGLIHAKIYLPNADRGYYRGARFDWSGVIARLEYSGHNYFGVWFPKYEPTLHDAITGPAEEFRSEEGALGYAAAKPGDSFVKIGVGILRKPDDRPYEFSRDYKILSSGVWVVRPYKDRVEFVQELKGVDGYSYVYKKTLRLVKGKPELVLDHSLKNTGKKTIDTQVYNHDFYVIDGQPTGPGFKVKFAFPAKKGPEFKGPAEIQGNELTYTRELENQGRESAFGPIEGFGSEAKDNDIRVENTKANAGVREIGSRPISKLFFWSIRTTVCPEAYIALQAKPGKTVKWSINYQFYTLDHPSEK